MIGTAAIRTTTTSAGATTTAAAPTPQPIPVVTDPRGFFTLDVPVVILLVMLWREIWTFRQDLRNSITKLDEISARLGAAVVGLLNPPPDKRD